MVEMIGYLGSILVVVSMLMSSVVRLRVINTIGSGIFAGYALLIHSYPTALMNACLVGINLYNLVRLRQGDRSYDLAETAPEDGLLRFLLARYREDIHKYFPGFVEQRTADRAYVVFCGGDPAGILLGTVAGQGTLKVTLDYSTPAYRDCSIGTYLYGKLPSKGVHTLIFGEEESQDHAAYLTRMGFSRENGVFVKHLD